MDFTSPQIPHGPEEAALSQMLPSLISSLVSNTGISLVPKTQDFTFPGPSGLDFVKPAKSPGHCLPFVVPIPHFGQSDSLSFVVLVVCIDFIRI